MFIAWIFTLKWVVETLSKLEKEKPTDKRIILDIFLVLFLIIFVFIIQAFIIPVPYGTSVGLLGAALAIILRSPWGAVLVMTPVIIVQSLFFAAGGVTTMGANLLNVGVIAGFMGFYIYKLAKPLGKIPRALIGGFFAGLLSLVVAHIASAVELWLAGIFPLALGIVSVTLYSAVAGVAEGIMTMIGCVLFVVLRSKDKVHHKFQHYSKRTTGLIKSLGLSFISIRASSSLSRPVNMWVAMSDGSIRP